MYFYRNSERFSDWQVVIIYPSRSIEQSEIYPYRALLNSNQVHRIYLNELGNIRQRRQETGDRRQENRGMNTGD